MAYQSRLELAVDSRSGERNLRSFERELNKADGAGSRLTDGLGAMKIALGAVGAVAGGFSVGRLVSETAAFEQSLLGLQVVSGATASQMKQLEDQSRSLGATSMFSAREAADAQNFLAMAGFNVNEVLEATPGILQLATAGQLDLASAADLASNVLGGLGLEVTELGRVNDVLAATAAGSNTSVRQLGEALSYAAPIAASAGINIEEAAASIGVLSDAGLQGSRAGTGLLGVIRQVSNLTPAATDALAQYGLTTEDVNVEQNGLLNVLEKLQGANINAADSFKIFGSEAGPAAQILAAGAARVNEFTGELELAEGTAARAAMVLGSGLTGSMRSFSSAVGESTLQLGRDSGLSGSLQEVINTATGVISVYNGMIAPFQEANDLTDDQARNLERIAGTLAATAGAVGALTGAYVGLTAATWAANAAQVALMRVMRANPIILAASAVTALSGALYTARNATVEFGDTQASVSDWLQATWQVNAEVIQGTTGSAVDYIIAAFSSISDPVSAVASYTWETFKALMGNLGTITQTTINAVIGYFSTIVDVVGIVTRTMQTLFTSAFDNILSVAGGFWDSVQAVFSGDLTFSAFNAAVENLKSGFVDTMAGAADEIGVAFRDNMSRDYLGEAFDAIGNGAQFLADDFSALGDRISEAAFIARMSRNGFGVVAEGFDEGQTSAQTLQLELDELMDRLNNTGEATDKLTKAQRDANREADQFARTLQSLTDRLYPVEAAQRTYREEQELLTLAWAKGEMGVMRYLDALNRLQQAQQMSSQTAAGAYGGDGGFGSEISARGEVGAPTDPLAGSIGNQDQDYWDKWLESASNAFTDFDQMAANTAESFQRGFGNAFESMIFDSESLKDAAQGMFEGMARTAVNAIGQMIAQWLAYQAVQALIGDRGAKQSEQQSRETGAQMAANYAPAAAAASLASFGSNAIPAIAGMTATYAIGGALSQVGFSDGGYTGAGGKYDPAGIVHAGEFVVRKEMVERPGVLSFLDGLNKGYASGGYVGSSPAFADRMPAYSEPKSQQAPPMRVTINNHTDSRVKATQDADGGLTIEMVKADLIQDMQYDGKFASAGKNIYGWGRVAK